MTKHYLVLVGEIQIVFIPFSFDPLNVIYVFTTLGIVLFLRINERISSNLLINNKLTTELTLMVKSLSAY